jgi:hypothetical protein
MMHPIRVELDEVPDCNELVGFLTSRGLACTPVTTGNGCTIDVGYAADPEERLHTEVSDALRSWLSGHTRPLIVTPVGDDSFVLRPPGD